jgi:glycosyltransferase involved in cell wall biosynthesis
MSETRIDNSPVRVCVVNPNFYRSSGVTVAIRRIYEATSALGVEQLFVSCGYGQGEEDKSWLPQAHFASFRLMDLNPMVVAKELRSLATWLRGRQVRIVHVHHRRLAAVLCACRSLFGCRVIYTGQLTYPFAPWFWPVRPDRATAISESVARNMRATTRIRETRIVSNPAVFPLHSDTGAAAETVVDAVCIARLEPLKGHEHLIKAWAILRDQGFNAKLALVGEGSLQKHLQSLIHKNGLNDLVELRGFQSDVKGEFLRGKFGLLVSRVEGQGIVVLEAAASGRASLLTRVDGLRDCLPPNRLLPNGVPFGDVPALVSALKVWLTRPDAVKREGKSFFEFLKRASSSEVVGQQYAALYREVALQNGV